MIKKKGERRKRKEKERENVTADAVSPSTVATVMQSRVQ
jgi:hypothetical protein